MTNHKYLQVTLALLTIGVAFLYSTSASSTVIWETIANGTFYGSTEVTPADDGLITVNLNTNAISAINASTGLFGVGGRLLTLSGPSDGDEWLFGHTDSSDLVRLAVDTAGGATIIDASVYGRICCGLGDRGISVSEFWVVGEVDGVSEYLNYFIFDVSALPGVAVGAMLLLDGGEPNTYRSQQASETFGVFGLDGVSVTEPTTLVLLGLGLVGIGIKHRSRK